MKVYTFDEICESQNFNHDEDFILKADHDAEVKRLQDEFNTPNPYCPICNSCGVDGCCPAERCLYPGIKEATVKEAKELFDEVLAEKKTLEAENLILKKKLEACKKQRNAETWQPFDGEGSKAAIEAYDKELESIS